MVSKRRFLIFWIGGLIAFAVVISLGQPLAIAQVPGGILDHQAAGTRANVDFIQQSWAREGLSNTAFSAMLGDLAFIGIYGIGCVLGGLYFRAQGAGFLKRIGTLALAAGLIFIVTDYAETIAQIVQLYRNEGSDTLAGLAAIARPIKFVSAALTVLLIPLGLVLDWRAGRAESV